MHFVSFSRRIDTLRDHYREALGHIDDNRNRLKTYRHGNCDLDVLQLDPRSILSSLSSQ